LRALRGAVQAAIHRIGDKPRKPKDFAHIAFASAVDALLEKALEKDVLAKPAA
jgi:hypothetical protein